MTVQDRRTSPSNGVLTAATFLLFAVWGSSFIAMSFLLGGEREAARLSPLGLTIGRMVTAALPIAIYLVGWRWSETVTALRRWPGRLLLCGAIGGPIYNLAIYSAQAQGLPAPVASVITTLVPLFVAVLSAIFLHEHISGRRWLGVVIGLSGVAIIASARGSLTVPYPLIVATAMLAPTSWSVYTVVTKKTFEQQADDEPIAPLVWTYIGIVISGLMVAPFLPRVIGDLRALDLSGRLAVGYLAIPCTVVGFALWTWLLQHLPASTVGLTVFLNPPMTLTMKTLMTALFPQVFVITVLAQELLGGLVVLAGLAVAIVRLGRSG